MIRMLKYFFASQYNIAFPFDTIEISPDNYITYCCCSITMLQGQIESEYIPPVLFEMPALRMLDLSDTKLNVLPETCSAQLRELYLNKNFLHKVYFKDYFYMFLRYVDMFSYQDRNSMLSVNHK